MLQILEMLRIEVLKVQEQKIDPTSVVYRIAYDDENRVVTVFNFKWNGKTFETVGESEALKTLIRSTTEYRI